MPIISEDYFPRGRFIANTRYDILETLIEDDVVVRRDYYKVIIDEGLYLVREEVIDEDGIVKATEYRDLWDSEARELHTTRQLVTLDDSSSNVKSWDSIEMRFDLYGVMDLKTTVYDNGRVRAAVYEEGEIAYARTKDMDNIYSWYEKIEYFDDSGTLAELATIYDDGRVIAEIYDGDEIVDTIVFASEAEWSNGRVPAEEITRTETVLDDGGKRVLLRDAATNLEDWDRVEITYDASGVITDRTVYYDDYLVNTETYENGILAYEILQDRDDKYDFRSREITYDENGEIATYYHQYDFTDGYRKFFENGVLIKVEKHDQIFDSPSGGYFSQQVIFFDEDGNKEYRVGEMGFDGMRYFQYDDEGDILVFASSNEYGHGDDFGIINHYDQDGAVISHDRYETEEAFDAALAEAFDEAPSDFFDDLQVFSW
ncbi:hypothetical protein [Loktanella sp. S4079]|uniref:hypothetical protein n=1 Tax=Loktanella sp. S4079 TaxID=579483 RepID=UPI0005FA8E04|nr:hypothetical protein [Loktanella sp. S4079]KJZ20622.1 hypothetical protein TW80_07570 [Loktanella sp. S4079]